MTCPATRLRRLSRTDDFEAVYNLLTRAFAYMEGRIDPPSSLNRVTPATLQAASGTCEIWVIEHGSVPLASVMLTPKPDALYIGKLAVDSAARGQGHAHRLIRHAATRARAMGLSRLELETRIELSENHAAFAALGFSKTHETAHPGYTRPTSITMQMQLG